MIRIQQCKCKIEDTRSPKQLAADFLGLPLSEIRAVHIRKRSLDARKKPELFYVYCLDVEVSRERNLLKGRGRKGVTAAPEEIYSFPACGTQPLARAPVVIGAGPAGLLAAYELAVHGYRPLLLERGLAVEQRCREVEAFWNGGPLNAECNVQFGEGGAGTFSDGKLNTMVKDPSGRIREVLKLFVECGADPEILYDSKPHIGTDSLCRLVRTLREKILAAGGRISFASRVTDLEIRENRLCAVHWQKDGCSHRTETSVCVLAIGHSARDTFEMLYERGIPMAAKPFAVGFRIEHPQSMIQESQYGPNGRRLMPAPYKVTAKTAAGRGVYSFCMCPGGMVVNASSEQGGLAVNGMSNQARDGRNANSAIIVTIQPEDFIGWNREFQAAAAKDGGPVKRLAQTLSGMEFQRHLERNAYLKAQGQIPVQLFGDYRCRRPSTGFGEVIPDMRGNYALGQVRGILPLCLEEAIAEGIQSFAAQIRGFDREDAVLSGVESRTSSPVKILRSAQMESEIRGLFPCGEGAGYAGGITSAAVDGLKMAETIVGRYARPRMT
ncbi:MAG: NAD(P)-binding protein [Lachnospiraceae bacterium]|nr:NAD(P)-binding protein [Lachnospiraceae bacterium]